jgi:hypothetical protein
MVRLTEVGIYAEVKIIPSKGDGLRYCACSVAGS